jgi:hypothetical protein
MNRKTILGFASHSLIGTDRILKISLESYPTRQNALMGSSRLTQRFADASQSARVTRAKMARVVSKVKGTKAQKSNRFLLTSAIASLAFHELILSLNICSEKY